MKIAFLGTSEFAVPALQALVDAGNVLNASQRQAFFKAWGERHGKRHG